MRQALAHWLTRGRRSRLAPGHRPALRRAGVPVLAVLALAVLAALGSVGAAAAQPGAPSPFTRIGFDQLVGAQVPGELAFRDESGRQVRLGDYFNRRPARPLVLALVYYNCPMLCPLTLNGLTRGLKGLSFDAGREFDVVVVSFDPRETPAMAAKARRETLERYGPRGTAEGWHFLTGPAGSVQGLTRALGFRYFYDPEIKQFAHPAGIVVLTPEGKLARYFYGIEFPSRSLRLSLVEAADDKIGSVVDQVLLYCFHYDPVQGKYSAVTLNIVRLGAILTVLGLGAMIALLRRHDPHPKPGPTPLGTA
jgi:protein SCO1/2